MKGKYIIVGRCAPILFPMSLSHRAMSQRNETLRVNGGGVTGAGFYKIIPCGKDVDVIVFDGSTSLGIEAKPEDADIIRAFMGFPIREKVPYPQQDACDEL